MKLIKVLKNVCFATSFIVVSNANADPTTWIWDLTPGSTGNSIVNGACGECATSSFSVTDTEGSNSVTASISGYADTTGNGDLDLETGTLHYYSGNGWGLVNKDETGADSQHTFDNIGSYIDDRNRQQVSSSADYDMALVSFDTSVALKAIDFGYIESDGDFTVLAFDMSKNINTTPSNTWGSVAGSGDWITVGNYDANSTGYYTINSSNTSSQYWLIGAYNSVFTGALESIGNLETGNDKFKIKRLKAQTPESQPPTEEVSAPAAFGLILLGTVGMVVRRKKTLKA
jgi:hypothetical protein